MDRPDAELLVASSAGSAEAYSVFFRRHVSAITRYAVRRCANPDDVADLVGECFLVALQAAHRYIPETDTALPWLFGIARRVLAKQRRKYVGDRRLEVKASNAFPGFTAAEDDAVASAIDAARQAPLLEDALARLTRSERDVLELVAYDGLSPTEAAVALDITPNAARLRLSRARRAVRAHMDTTTVVGAPAEDAGYAL
ncbi:MAG TPA: RNA polymerase sigma factor [Acidimicrobiia bacterium]